MASSFLPSEEQFLMDPVGASTLDLSSDNVAPGAWRVESWGIPAMPDNFVNALDSTFDPLASPVHDSDDSTTDLDEFASPAPSSPSSVATPMYDNTMMEFPYPGEVESYDEMLQEDEPSSEDSSETVGEEALVAPLAYAATAAPAAMPVHPSPSVSSPATSSSASSASVASSSAAASTKRRGRPKTKVAATPAASGSRKRRAEGVLPETLLGTKKSKNASAAPNLLDRLPSSISAVELQGMSSADFEAYYSAVAPKLSKSEDEIAKLQRRRIKNRESASNSRVRKQDNLADLEAQVQQLRDQNETLRQKALAIQSEHRAMSRELDNYKRLVREHVPPQYVPPFFAASSSNTPAAHHASSSNNSVVHVNTRTGRSTRVLARDVSSAALMCLVLFAMIWGTTTVIPGSVLRDAKLPAMPHRISFPDTTAMAPVSSALVTTHTKRSAAAAAASLASSSNAVQNDGAWLARAIKDTQRPQLAASLPELTPASSSMNVAAPRVQIKKEMMGSVEPTTMSPTDLSASAVLVSTEEIKPSNDTLLNAHLGGTPLATSSSSASTAATDAHEEASSSSMDLSAPVSHTIAPQWKQNTTYIKCDGMQHVLPPAGAQPAVDPNSPLFVSLWVNPQSIGGSSLQGASKDPFNLDYLVQITCQIVSVDQLNLLATDSSPLPSAPELSLPTALAQSSS